MMSALPRTLWNRAQTLLPVRGFFFDRPLVLLQSDDWGRVGLQDQEGFDRLTAAGLKLGERPYDFYTLETADDVNALGTLLKAHRDSTGRPACLGMNFLTANLDFVKMADFREIKLLSLADGLPKNWKRPGLFEAYHAGIESGVFNPALHGTTHFSCSAVERHLMDEGERGQLLRKLWRAGDPYIHWRMPWIGYEYWDPENPDGESFLSLAGQAEKIGWAVGSFAKLFSRLPRSACAPGYRANQDTITAYGRYGIRVSQNGARALVPPHFDGNEILELYRTVDLEPAVAENFSLKACLKAADRALALGLPAIVSVHSINFHSSVKDYRSKTLDALDQFLTALEQKYSNLLYLHDEDLWQLVQTGAYPTDSRPTRVVVTKKRVSRRGIRTEVED
jgi:hypothetical protein